MITYTIGCVAALVLVLMLVFQKGPEWKIQSFANLVTIIVTILSSWLGFVILLWFVKIYTEKYPK